MDATTSGSTRQESLFRRPAHQLGYIAIFATILTAGIHLWLGPRGMGFSQMLGTLFILNGLGYLGGLVLYLSRYWRRSLYLIAATYAVLTIFAFFGFQGLSFEAFYSRGSLNQLAVIAKFAELVLAVSAVYLYSSLES